MKSLLKKLWNIIVGVGVTFLAVWLFIKNFFSTNPPEEYTYVQQNIKNKAERKRRETYEKDAATLIDEYNDYFTAEHGRAGGHDTGDPAGDSTES